MNASRWVVAISFAGLVTAGIDAQAPPTSAPGQTTVTGTVVDAVTRRPVGGAVVTLFTVSDLSVPLIYRTSFDGMEIRGGFQLGHVMTSGNGRFRFNNVGEGAFGVSTQKSGWVQTGWEANEPELRGEWMAIASSMKAIEITVPLQTMPVIRGRVLDENGDPAVGALVTAYQPLVQAGESPWHTVGMRWTDDRGVFWFSVPPGDSVLHARPVTMGTDQPLVYQSMFFSSATALAQAQVLRLRPGDVRTDIDFRFEPVRAFKVSGQLVGVRHPGARVTLAHVDAGSSPDRNAADSIRTAGPDGRFAFQAVPVGAYVLRVVQGPNIPNGSHGTPPLERLPPEPTLAAELALNVVDHDLDLTVPLQPGVRISGRVEFDGEPSAEEIAQLKGIAILIERADAVEADLRGLFLDAKTFATIQIPPGRYIMRTSWVPRGWTLKSIIHDRRDITDEPIEIGAADVTDVVMTFTKSRSFLTGTVTGAAQKHLRPWVIAFPHERGYWMESGRVPRRLSIIQLGTAGTYKFELLPGGYFVCVLPDQPLALTADVLSTLASRATQVWLGENEQRVQTLPLMLSGARR